jgi:hypothetical protein
LPWDNRSSNQQWLKRPRELNAPEFSFPTGVFLPDDFAFQDSTIEFGDFALQSEFFVLIQFLSVFLNQIKKPISEFVMH